MALVLLTLSCTELLLWTKPLWPHRKIVASLFSGTLVIVTILLLLIELDVWTVLLGLASLYRCINLARIAADRMQADYLFYASRHTALRLIAMQLVIVAAAAFDYYYAVDTLLWWMVLAITQLAGAGVLLGSTLRHLRTTSPPELRHELKEKDLPGLTVAIPARNETADLEECLQSVTASTYPKLEILVLDDCSQNQRTPEIIREFAQHGVQFIAGAEPPASWLAKNYAYEQLATAANSDLLLFCGVDARFQPESFKVIVETMLQKKKTMFSIMPRNVLPKRWNIQSFFVQPSRYAWELALPRRLLERPPVLSTCWLISREALNAAGSFQAVRRKGVPESYFARATAAENDGYSFLHTNAAMGITSRKTIAEQRATAIRSRYVQLHRRIELVALVSMLELLALVWPLCMSVIGLLHHQWVLTIVSALSYVMISTAYSKIVNLTYGRFLLTGLWVLPFAALYDIALLNYSMWQYEFSEVLWKGRNICLPIMRVLPQLPRT